MIDKFKGERKSLEGLEAVIRELMYFGKARDLRA
jgi:hypothetical protein